MSERRLTIGLARRLSRLPNLVTDRAVRLRAIIPIAQRDLADESFEGRLRIVRALRRALRQERVWGRSGSPAYSIERHAALLRCCRYEEAELFKVLRRELAVLSEHRRVA